MTQRNVLVAPIDWGLGHATRCIPIIHELLARGCQVVLAGAGYSLQLLKAEFPSLVAIELTGYNPRYSRSSSLTWTIAWQLGKFIRTVRQEHREIERIVESHHIDVVISDNRFGCWSANVKSIFITHQVNILMPAWMKGSARIVNYFNHRQIKRFDCCWIPDFPGEASLAGKLSENRHLRVRYIGWLSRLNKVAHAARKYDVLVVLSGPEPQRSLLEKLLTDQLLSGNIKSLIVRGVSGAEERSRLSEYVEVIDFATANELQSLYGQCNIVVARSGYSTVMDLVKLGLKAIFIPTPGQTEQEHLARELERKKIAFFMEQRQFNLTFALDRSKHYTGFEGMYVSDESLSHALGDVLDNT